MFWRFLLVAAVVSCTLTRSHAHGPRDRIKDLMCVLLLGGVQKEDLDVSVLNKLRRYNVNIHDTNNEDLLQECMTLRNKSSRDMINTTLINANGVSDGLIKENYNSPQTPSKSLQTNIDPSVQTVNTEQEINNDTIQYIDGKPKLDSVLKFWQDMKLNKETTESPKNNNDNVNTNEKYVTEPKHKRNAQENSDSNEEDDIKRLIKNYFSKRQRNKNNKRTKKETTTLINIIDKQHADNRYDNVEIVRRLPSILPLDVREDTKSRIRIRADDTKPYNENFSDIFSAFNRFNNKNEDFIRYSKENRRLSDNPYLRNFMESNRLVSTTERDDHQKISNAMIKEIANSVKEIVLRDLKFNIQETTTLRTSSVIPITTEVTKATLSTTIDNTVKIQQSVLNKFLEMFEEIKALKKNTLLISSNINKQNVQVLPQTLPLVSLSGVGSIPPYNNPYRVKYPKSKSKNLNFQPQEHRFRSNEPQVTIRAAPKSLLPMMFQTNNLEIPPLGIPIDEPINPINQNIIVTTETPYRIGIIKNNLKPRNNPFADLYEYDERNPKQSRISKTRDSNINVPTSYDVRFTSTKGQKPHPGYYDKIRLENYRPRSDNAEYIKTPEAPRFHERLENVDFLDDPDKKRYTDIVDCCNEKYAYSKQMVECCNRKIASRHQMSLNNMKKGSYDDRHFKNFLKTQQKVTDMLEKILATRDTVRSVETT